MGKRLGRELNPAERGKRIASFRRKCEMTQEMLAEKVDISPNMLSLIENGHKSAKIETYLKIASECGVTLDCFFYENYLDIEECNEIIGVLKKANCERRFASEQAGELCVKTEILLERLANNLHHVS